MANVLSYAAGFSWAFIVAPTIREQRQIKVRKKLDLFMVIEVWDRMYFPIGTICVHIPDRIIVQFYAIPSMYGSIMQFSLLLIGCAPFPIEYPWIAI